MAGKSLKYQIILGGKVSNTFGQLGQALDYLGQEIDTVSRKAINFGKESVESYVEYDDIMRQVQALGEYDTNTMKNLDTYNRSIAQSSKYTMAEIAEAEVMMAQIGLGMKDTQTLMPVMMNFAAAAGIDLADSLDYLYYTLNALGLPMENASVLSDQMAKASAISAADIDTLGESLQRLGSASQLFTGGSAEILAILSGISNISEDMQGSEAGTYLRNFMLTLLAPTGSKATIMESLGITEDAWSDFESYMDEAGITVTNTSAAMSKLGLSVYDSATGEIKPALQIIGELKAALDGLTPEERNQTLSDLFGKRTYVLASNLLSVYDDILADYNEISGGSEGYTEYMAAIVEGGLGGAMRELEAAYSELKTNIGEIISEPVQNVAEWLHGIVTDISNMDDAKLNAIVGAVEVVAGAGPALLVMSAGMKALSFILTPGGLVATGIIAITAFMNALNEWDKEKFSEQFGEMALGAEDLSEFLGDLGQGFSDAYSDVDKFNGALETSIENYKTASSTFSSKLLSAMITQNELTPDEISDLQTLGSTIGSTVAQALADSAATSMSFLNYLFGGDEEALSNPLYQKMIQDAGEEYDTAYATALSIGQKLRDALTQAFADDNTISEEEYENIKSLLRSYNEMIAKAEREVASEEAQVQRQILLNKAQTASYDEIQNYATQMAEQRDAELAAIQEQFEYEYAKRQISGKYTDEELAAFQAEYDERVAEVSAPYSEAMMRMYTGNAKESGLADEYDWAEQVAEKVLSGELSMKDAIDEYFSSSNANDSNQLNRYLTAAIRANGGADALFEQIAAYTKAGETDSANDLLKLFVMQQLAGQYSEYYDSIWDTWFKSGIYSENARKYNERMEPYLPNGEQEINVTDNGTGAALKTALDETFDDTITQEVVVTQTTAPEGFANGGRATTASIFGEAGAEWAIPEQHTERTASLLNAARAASGFTWPELIARNGGLNGNAGGSTQQLIYSPTIIANDASGVEAKLREDKERLERWLEERSLRRAVEAYV